MNEETAGSLERLGIHTETPLDEDMLTPASIKAVRFRKAKPIGYSFREVDELMEMVISSVSKYAKKLHDRDLDVHKLGRELDLERTNFLNAQGELRRLQVAAGFGAAQAQLEDDKEGEALLARITSLQTDLEAANQQVSSLQEALAEAEATGDTSDVEAQLVEVREQYLTLHTRYSEDTESLQNEVSERNSRILELEAKVAELESATPAGATDITPEREAQLLEHIEGITTQYGQVVEMYNDVNAELEAAKASGSGGEELEAALARIEELETELSAQSQAPQGVALPDPNATPSTPAPTRQYSNLPPGVRPEDLEGSEMPNWNRPRN